MRKHQPFRDNAEEEEGSRQSTKVLSEVQTQNICKTDQGQLLGFYPKVDTVAKAKGIGNLLRLSQAASVELEEKPEQVKRSMEEGVIITNGVLFCWNLPKCLQKVCKNVHLAGERQFLASSYHWLKVGSQSIILAFSNLVLFVCLLAQEYRDL